MAGPPPWRTPVLLAAAGTAFGTYVLVVTAPDRHHDSTSTLFSGAVGGLYLGAGLLARLRRPGNPVGLLSLNVTDDGVGGADPGDGGTGLLGLRHRVSAYDGRLTVRSGPGEGTVVAVTLPTTTKGEKGEPA